MNFNRFVFMAVSLAVLGSPEGTAQPFQVVQFGTKDGGKIAASFFRAGKSKAVIFAHGAIFNKESWYFLAEAFQREGVAALSIDFRGYGFSTPGSTSNKMYDILGAIAYLKEQGFTDISVVGASMGGAAVLAALGNNSIPTHKVVLLAPAGGPAIESAESGKLFVVSQNDRMFNGVMATYTASAEPKQIKVYPGSAHAQYLFKTDVRDELIERIVNFINP